MMKNKMKLIFRIITNCEFGTVEEFFQIIGNKFKVIILSFKYNYYCFK